MATAIAYCMRNLGYFQFLFKSLAVTIKTKFKGTSGLAAVTAKQAPVRKFGKYF